MIDSKRSHLALLAVALLASACDPFPAAPGGTPSVIRVGATGGNLVAIDNPNPVGMVVDDAAYNASFYVWFSKEMDGSSVQATPNYDAQNKAVARDVSCSYPNSPLAQTSSGWPAATNVCYAPGSVEGGGLIQVFRPTTPAPGSFFVVGAYKLAGTVRDYQGNPIAFDVTFNVTLKPTLTVVDPYTIDVAWPNQVGAADFSVERAEGATEPAAASAAWVAILPNQIWVDPLVNGATARINAGTNITGVIRNWGLTPGTKYYYRIRPAGGTPGSTTTATVAAAPALLAQVNPPGSTPGTNTVALFWDRIRDDAANGKPSAIYRVERKTTAAGAAFAEVGTVNATDASLVTFTDTGMEAGSYVYQVVPVFTAGAGTVNGVPTDPAEVTVP